MDTILAKADVLCKYDTEMHAGNPKVMLSVTVKGEEVLNEPEDAYGSTLIYLQGQVSKRLGLALPTTNPFARVRELGLNQQLAHFCENDPEMGLVDALLARQACVQQTLAYKEMEPAELTFQQFSELSEDRMTEVVSKPFAVLARNYTQERAVLAVLNEHDPTLRPTVQESTAEGGAKQWRITVGSVALAAAIDKMANAVADAYIALDHAQPDTAVPLGAAAAADLSQQLRGWSLNATPDTDEPQVAADDFATAFHQYTTSNLRFIDFLESDPNKNAPLMRTIRRLAESHKGKAQKKSLRSRLPQAEMPALEYFDNVREP